MHGQPFQLLEHKLRQYQWNKEVPEKKDYEYVRKGSCSIFVFTEPLAGWRHICASQRHTKKDWAFQIQELLEVYYLHARRIRLVMDNLNTHTISSLYEIFPPAKALELSKRLGIHYTSKHGSWLNIAEIELSAMTQ